MSTGAETKPGGGLKSALKIAVPLVALVGVVFGITYIMQYTPPKETDTGTKTDGNPGSAAEPPLRFFSMSRHWDPPLTSVPGYRHFPLLAPSAVSPDKDSPDQAFAFSPQNRVFQGFYEPSQDSRHLRKAQFWFENRNSNPVLVKLLGVSCGKCTGARVAALPPDVTRSLFQNTALAALPVGVFNPYGVCLTQPLGGLVRPPDQGGLQWTEYGFEADPNATYRVPAATNPDKWTPQWGILELKFKVTDAAPAAIKPLHAKFATQVEGTNQTGEHEFVIAFESARPFDVAPASIDAGKFLPDSGERTFDLLVYSTTRGPGSEFGDLDLPSVSIDVPGGTDPDPVKFIEVTKIERQSPDVLVDMAEQIKNQQKRLVPVRSAYRLTVAVRPKVGETRMDIGLVERMISISAAGTSLQVPVRAIVRGPVWLESDNPGVDRNDFELSSFRGGDGTTQTVKLITERPGIDLAVVGIECKQAKLGVELVKQPDSGGRGRYDLKVHVPPGQVFGPLNGMVLLEIKGPTPQRMRIPFKGTGRL
jgi:hypothetical protein